MWEGNQVSQGEAGDDWIQGRTPRGEAVKNIVGPEGCSCLFDYDADGDVIGIIETSCPHHGVWVTEGEGSE